MKIKKEPIIRNNSNYRDQTDPETDFNGKETLI